MKNAWFQIHPDRIKNVASSLPDGRMRATLTLILMTYLAESGLPDDDRKIAFLCGLPVEDVSALRPYWEFMGRIEEGRIYIDYAEEVIAEQQMFVEKKAKAARARWEKWISTSGQPGQTLPDEKTLQMAEEAGLLEETPNGGFALSDAEQGYAMHNTAQQSNAELCQTTNHSSIQPSNQTRNAHVRAAQQAPTRQEYPTGSVMAKIDAMEQAVIRTYEFSYIDPSLDKQIKSSVGKCNAAGFGLADMETFFGGRQKLPGINFLCNEMQTWRASRSRQSQGAQSDNLYTIPPVPEGLTRGQQKTFIENAIKAQKAQREQQTA